MKHYLILVAHARNGLAQALNVAEILKPFAAVQLCSYDLFRDQLPQEPDALLCIVTDEASIEQAHVLQGQLEDVPTFVVDNSSTLKIELNGYAGRVTSSPDHVLGSVLQFLTADEKRSSAVPTREPKRMPRRISTPFTHILARTTGHGQTSQAMLVASARQLASDLQAERIEVFQHFAETNTFRHIYDAPERGGAKDSSPSPEVIRLIKRRPYPMTPGELVSRSFGPLRSYMISKRLNVIVPLAKEARLLGWLGFRLEAERCTDDLLDDIQIAGHLLSIGLADAMWREEQSRDACKLEDALLGFRSGIAVVDQDGQVVCVAGASAHLGSRLQKGDHFKSIQNSHVREVLANALHGKFMAKSWTDLGSQERFASCSTRLANGQIALLWGPGELQRQRAERNDATAPGPILKEVLDSLPVPVLLESESTPGSDACPEGRITEADSQAIRDCALQAQAKNVKALRLRWGKRRSSENAVLFYEAETHEGSAEFADDIQHAVRFSLEAA